MPSHQFNHRFVRLALNRRLFCVDRQTAIIVRHDLLAVLGIWFNYQIYTHGLRQSSRRLFLGMQELFGDGQRSISY